MIRSSPQKSSPPQILGTKRQSSTSKTASTTGLIPLVRASGSSFKHRRRCARFATRFLRSTTWSLTAANEISLPFSRSSHSASSLKSLTMSKTRRFLSLTSAERRRLVRAFLIVAGVRMGLTLMSFPRFQALHIKFRTSLNVKRGAEPTTEQLAWDVGVVSRYVPRATCLTQALAGQVMLERYGYPALVGVTKNKGTRTFQRTRVSRAMARWLSANQRSHTCHSRRRGDGAVLY